MNDLVAQRAGAGGAGSPSAPSAETRRHLEVMDALDAIASAISARVGSDAPVLDQLAQTAMSLLNADRAGVTLVDADGRTLRIVAYAGDRPAGSRSEFYMGQLPATRRVIESNEFLFLEDASKVDAGFNKGVADEFRAGSIVLIPLRVAGKLAGMLALSNTHPRRFSEVDRGVARLLGSHAAVVLANHQLHQQTLAALEAQRESARQRDALFAINAQIYESASFEESLQKIVQMAPGALGVDHCLVGLWEANEQMFIAAANAPPGVDLVGRRFDMHGSASSWAIRNRRTCIAEGANPPEGHQPQLQRLLNAGSGILMPLLRPDGSPLGVLTLVRRATGGFTQEQVDLAEAFGARVAGALEKARLHEQARQDAEKRALLLRELNHRVKNSLTGILGLLSLERPEMPPRAAAWLDRAIDRIRTMIQAHNVFAGGVDCVAAERIIDAVAPSLAVLKQPDIELRTQLSPGASVLLSTQQAVSLAMVLHELCANALVHALRAGAGLLLIRTRGDAGAPLSVDVIDCAPGSAAPGGAGEDPPAWAADSTEGIGLKLVRELVARELKGTFRLKRHDGGTIATVTFEPASDGRQGVVV